MEYGYARVSSTEQNLDRQVLALQEYVKPENIVMDRQSGKNLDRPGLKRNIWSAPRGCFIHSEPGPSQQEQGRHQE